MDGDLTDWGIVVADGNASNISAYAGYSGIDLLDWMSEDTNDNSNSYYVGPNYGGQNYDAEFLAAATAGGKLYLAIVSGQRPDNGPRLFAPGDIRIETTSGIFGIEVGGGLYGGGDDGSFIEEGAPGTTYELNSHGYTISVDYSITQLAGSVWQDALWRLDPIAPGVETQQLSGGTLVGLADYYFSRNSYGTQHSIIELSVPLTAFGPVGLDAETDIFWRPSCGNDELQVGFTHIAPLPGAVGPGLAVFALLSLAGVIRRRRAAV